MTPQIKQMVDYIADSFINYEQIVAESENKVLINIESKYRNTFFDKSLSHGVPSLILMYSSLYKVTKDERYLTFSNIYVEKLVDIISRDGIESPSLYAGTAGIALAIKEASISGKYYPKLLSSLNCLLKEQTRMAWCYGTPGTAVALFKMCQLIDLNFIDDINESLIAQMRSSDKNVYSLTMCHGLAGVTFIYDLIGKNYSSERLTRFAEELRQQIITSFSTTKVFGYTDREKFGEIEVELESIGILQGVSGIVLFLLNPYSDEELLWQRIFI